MDDIPITFEHKGKEYKGIFTKVMGAGSNSTFFLNVDGYYFGQLILTDLFGWQFSSNSKPELSDLSEYFGDYIMLWYG